MMTSAFRVRPRPFPIRVKPYPAETVASYVNRIEDAHKLDGGTLVANQKSTGLSWLEYLTSVTNRPAKSLQYALPELREGFNHPTRPYWDHFSKLIQDNGYACERCRAARCINRPVPIWASYENVLCYRHKIWTGGNLFRVKTLVSVADMPEISRAHHMHKKLIAQHGKIKTRKAFSAAELMVFEWDRIGQLPTCAKRLESLAERDHHRSSVLSPHMDPRAPLARYPELLAMTRLVLDPQWSADMRSKNARHRALSVNRVVAEVTGRYRPTTPHDPLTAWAAGESYGSYDFIHGDAFFDREASPERQKRGLRSGLYVTRRLSH
ncbi:hypothetical protein [Segniliparus rugosus]|uniref:TniQ protein n=1 Tax=Segniliparus rugosus (strain ATCC BAA-974 / DSM 45345 / CCUG 50838 / CIP 108380 / JCM 13579 / CDC 945) TaxID=679197 RepID=E5XPA7_SEGRC|nr:hypothetical protein [Segniliparus rugosus]EFV13816.1 hypothetical protein HMPREF9336_01329 [Segniliparus rugosus ATCC BAA-974]